MRCHLQEQSRKDDMRDNAEVEFKLACDAAALSALRDWQPLKAAPSKATGDLESVYFDTVDHALQKAGYVLRVRKTDDGYVQTAKAGGDGLLERKEWERRIKGPKPDVIALKKTPLAGILGKNPELELQFIVLVERTTFLINRGDSEIEIALDFGRVTKPGPDDGRASEAVCEVELELKRGCTSDLFVLARDVGGEIPVRIGVTSKAERGFELQNPPSGVRKAEPV
jgi:triphosphatase